MIRTYNYLFYLLIIIFKPKHIMGNCCKTTFKIHLQHECYCKKDLFKIMNNPDSFVMIDPTVVKFTSKTKTDNGFEIKQTDWANILCCFLTTDLDESYTINENDRTITIVSPFSSFGFTINETDVYTIKQIYGKKDYWLVDYKASVTCSKLISSYCKKTYTEDVEKAFGNFDRICSIVNDV